MKTADENLPSKEMSKKTFPNTSVANSDKTSVANPDPGSKIRDG
jgi:hypothetical protein